MEMVVPLREWNFKDALKKRRLTWRKGKFPVKGLWTFAPVHKILPEELSKAFVEGMEQFGKVIDGFSDGNALVEGIESRTSSPVRIIRDESFQSSVRGLYPCGEGAGYAGGITSAAMDGIRVAEAVAEHIVKSKG